MRRRWARWGVLVAVAVVGLAAAVAAGSCDSWWENEPGPACQGDCQCRDLGYDSCLGGHCQASTLPGRGLCSPTRGLGDCFCKGGACVGSCCQLPDGGLVTDPSNPACAYPDAGP